MKILAILAIFVGTVKILSCLAHGTTVTATTPKLPISEDTINKIGNGIISIDALIEIFCGIFILTIL